MASKFGVTGLRDVARNIEKAHTNLAESAKVTVYAQAIALDQLINRNSMVPVDTGQLRASHYVTLPVVTDAGITSEIGYGAEYADEVHERGNGKGFKGKASADKGKKWRSGTPQWMKRGVHLWRLSLPKRMRDQLNSAMIKGTTVESISTVVPTAPVKGDVGRYQRSFGYTKEQHEALRAMGRNKTILLVGRKKRGRGIKKWFKKYGLEYHHPGKKRKKG